MNPDNEFLQSGPPPSPELFKVFLGYSDLGHERIGRNCCEKLSFGLGLAGRIIVTEWKFQMLASPALMEMAVEEATAADILIFATSAREGLPRYSQALLERCFTPAHSARRILVLGLSNPEWNVEWSCVECSRVEAQAMAHGIGIPPRSGEQEESDKFWLTTARHLVDNRLSQAFAPPSMDIVNAPPATESTNPIFTCV